MMKIYSIFFSFVMVILFTTSSESIFAICTDTDSGEYPSINYNIKGTATSGSDSLLDYCTSNVLVEYYCNSQNDARVLNTVYKCEEGCADGTCSEFIESPSQTQPQAINTNNQESSVSGSSLNNAGLESSAQNNNPSILEPQTTNPDTLKDNNLNEQSNKETNLFNRIIKLGSGPELIAILLIISILSIWIFKKRITNKFQ